MWLRIAYGVEVIYQEIFCLRPGVEHKFSSLSHKCIFYIMFWKIPSSSFFEKTQKDFAFHFIEKEKSSVQIGIYQN